MNDDEPSPELVEAWLAGELSDEEAKAFEQSLEDSAPTDPADGDFIDLKTEPLSEEVDLLIRHVRDEGGHTPPDVDEWRDILQPSDDPELLGTLGTEPRYEISSVIAVGGMSIVFKGRDPKLNRTVAIKTLTPELAANRITHERFLREARSASRLEHDHIIPIYGVHDEDGVPFIAMKFIEGGTLQDVLDSEREISIDRQQSIARQMAMALDFAHGEGVIHRDIKPANILLDTDGERAWLCDFGVARSTEDPSLTYAGSVAGTPQYMAPEQASGEKYDHRCDLFSLGAVLYRCATGQPAFAGKTTRAVLKNLTESEAPRVRRLNPKLPTWYSHLIASLIAKEPHDRLPDAGAVMRAIDTRHAPHSERSTRRRHLAALAFLIALISIPLALIAKREPTPAPSFSLAAAVAAAADGDIIDIPPGEHILIDSLEIPIGKSLTLRSTPGDNTDRPVITTKADATGLVTHSRLHLTGLDFKINPSHVSHGILNIVDTEAIVQDCRFYSHLPPFGSSEEFSSRAIELRGAATLDLRSSRITLELRSLRIILAFSNAISVDGQAPAHIRIRDSEISASHGCIAHGAHPVEIDISDTHFHGHHFLKGAPGSIPQVQLHAQDSSFAIGQALVWYQASDADTVSQRFHYTSEGTTYPVGKAWLHISAVPHSDKRSVTESLTEKPYEGKIQIEGSSKSYIDLATACAAAQDGATLLLSGVIQVPAFVATPRGHTLHFRAATGAAPTLLITDPAVLGMNLRGPTTFHDVTFLRLYADGANVPPLVQCSDTGPFHFERCRFESTPRDWNRSSGTGIKMRNAKEVTFRHCTFHLPACAALNIEHSRSTSTKLTIEDSLVSAGLLLFHRPFVSGAASNFTARRSIFIGSSLLADSHQSAPVPLHFDIRDSLLDIESCYFNIPIPYFPKIHETLKWTGSGNHYRPGAAALLSTAAQMQLTDQPADYNGWTMAKFLTDFPRVSDHQATHAPIFRNHRIHHPITPTALRTLLFSEVESPAIQTLEHLSTKQRSEN